MVYGFSLIPVEDANMEAYLRLFHDLFPHDFHSTHLCKLVDYRRWIVVVGGDYAGICGLYGLQGYVGDVWLDWFGLLPEYRGRGIGKAVLQEMFVLASGHGAHRALIWTTDMELGGTYLAHFYKARGFEETHWPLVYNQSPVTTFHRELSGTACCGLSELKPDDWLH